MRPVKRVYKKLPNINSQHNRPPERIIKQTVKSFQEVVRASFVEEVKYTLVNVHKFTTP